MIKHFILQCELITKSIEENNITKRDREYRLSRDMNLRDLERGLAWHEPVLVPIKTWSAMQTGIGTLTDRMMTNYEWEIYRRLIGFPERIRNATNTKVLRL